MNIDEEVKDMSIVKVPEPVAFRWKVPIVDSDGRQYGESDWKIGAEKGGLPWWTQDSLITTTQAEAYADARVREELEVRLRDVQAERDALAAECQEQARLNGMGAEREARLLAERDALREALETMVEMVEMNWFGRAYAMDVARAALAQGKEEA